MNVFICLRFINCTRQTQAESMKFFCQSALIRFHWKCESTRLCAPNETSFDLVTARIERESAVENRWRKKMPALRRCLPSNSRTRSVQQEKIQVSGVYECTWVEVMYSIYSIHGNTIMVGFCILHLYDVVISFYVHFILKQRWHAFRKCWNWLIVWKWMNGTKVFVPRKPSHHNAVGKIIWSVEMKANRLTK